MDKLFLLDAYALIYRAYYALIKNPRINSKGFNTSAILGFVNTLEDVLKKENPTHIGVAFDPSGPTFRHEAFEQYKAQREETPEAIRLSVPIIKDIIRAYRIPILEMQGFEADDVIGTVSYYIAGDLVGTTDLVAAQSYERDFVIYLVEKAQEIISSLYFKVVLAVTLVIFGLIALYVYHHAKKAEKMQKIHRGR